MLSFQPSEVSDPCGSGPAPFQCNQSKHPIVRGGGVHLSKEVFGIQSHAARHWYEDIFAHTHTRASDS